MREEEQMTKKLTSTEFIVYLKEQNPDLYASYTQKLATKYNDYVKFVQGQIKDYYFWYRWYTFIHSILQVTIIVGAAALPYLLILTTVPRAVLIIISSIVALAAAIIKIYTLGERSRQAHFIANRIAQEYRWFKSGRNIYKTDDLGIEETMDLLMDRVETIIGEHHARYYTPSKELQKNLTPEDLITQYVDRAEALIETQPLKK